jgi:hypothetical protein
MVLCDDGTAIDVVLVLRDSTHSFVLDDCTTTLLITQPQRASTNHIHSLSPITCKRRHHDKVREELAKRVDSSKLWYRCVGGIDIGVSCRQNKVTK